MGVAMFLVPPDRFSEINPFVLFMFVSISSLYSYTFIGPKMLIGITKTSYGAALAAVLTALIGGIVIHVLIVWPAFDLLIKSLP
jgi:hypothetical protein